MPPVAPIMGARKRWLIEVAEKVAKLAATVRRSYCSRACEGRPKRHTPLCKQAMKSISDLNIMMVMIEEGSGFRLSKLQAVTPRLFTLTKKMQAEVCTASHPKGEHKPSCKQRAVRGVEIETIFRRI